MRPLTLSYLTLSYLSPSEPARSTTTLISFTEHQTIRLLRALRLLAATVTFAVLAASHHLRTAPHNSATPCLAKTLAVVLLGVQECFIACLDHHAVVPREEEWLLYLVAEYGIEGITAASADAGRLRREGYGGGDI